MNHIILSFCLLSILTVFMMAITSIIGYQSGYENGKADGIKSMQTEALQYHYGKFVTQNNQIVFKWNEGITHE